MAEETEEPQKNKGGRPKGATTKKKGLNEDVRDVLDKKLKRLALEALESDDVSEKEKMAIIRDLLPYAASKKTEEKKEIPENLKFVKIIIKGYNPGEDPFADDDKPEETEE
ncbi:hypothetical protein ABID22_000147 [Pontibacter aydingkolensis]|uniref:DEK C-terminal domain-containing protein n=1 Tax=Pontibacter aydingkolensis TaxID=1911536 RepID=A0ABS7CQV6_9BACT|nr:hypothetical protein [Pontibacter aydingkolensis]MBW7466185.1 hypothetical protein [Pontibacter aydingkolensis]